MKLQIEQKNGAGWGGKGEPHRALSSLSNGGDEMPKIMPVKLCLSMSRANIISSAQAGHL